MIRVDGGDMSLMKGYKVIMYCTELLVNMYRDVFREELKLLTVISAARNIAVDVFSCKNDSVEKA